MKYKYEIANHTLFFFQRGQALKMQIQEEVS